MPSACPGSRPGAEEKQRRLQEEAGKLLVAISGDSLCVSGFPCVLENTDTNPVPFLQLLGPGRLFMNEVQEWEERACVTPAVG